MLRKSVSSSPLAVTLTVYAAFCIVVASSAYAETVAGNAVAVRPNANLSNPEGTRPLVVGMDVAMGDRIRTDKAGEVQLVFSDETRLVVGPNSSLVIEAYLLRSSSRDNNFTVRALGGSFRMITGKSDKKAYKIKTPAATIGVRGTSFDFTVGRNGRTGLLLYSGSAELCGGGGCRMVSGYCSLAETGRNQGVRVLDETGERNAAIRENFRYAVSQQNLRRDFRLRTRACGDDTAANIGTKERAKREARSPARAATPEKPDKPHHGHHGHHGHRGHHGHHGHHDRGERGGRRR